jgi:hypothetical protein
MITIAVDPSAVLARLSDVEQRQVPYAMKNALNALANEAQKSMQEGLKHRFHLRRESWNLRGIKILNQDRASKTEWRVIIQVSPQTSYLNKFEKGGDKVPVGGHNYIWEPNAKVFKNQIIPQSSPLRPKALHLHLDEHGRIIGNERTFIAKTGNAEIPMVVVQRTKSAFIGPVSKMQKRITKMGKKSGGTVTLYKLRKRVPIKAQLEFIPTIEKTVHSRFRACFDDALTYAMRPRK